MASMKESMILRAMTEYCKGHNSFRNRHLAHLAGVDRQDVNYFLKKWSKKGFVSKNPLAPGEWILVDLPGLVEDISSSNAPVDLAHSKSHPLFNSEELTKLKLYTDIYAALKALKKNPTDLRVTLEKYIDEALLELRTERSYMHRKTFSQKRATALVKKHEGLVKELGYDVSDLEVEEIKPLVLVKNEEIVPQEETLIEEAKRICNAALADYHAGKNVNKWVSPIDSLYKRFVAEGDLKNASKMQDVLTSMGV